ncbi:MAG: 5-methylthioadenosine/S-adenosylhomocysteine nucleosidase [Gammaproteobacteria bacterium]|nr:5-methylthioadenosine/S-adenosylhomocysteine nucleosidase [Gammaproteobacteria bacterium]
MEYFNQTFHFKRLEQVSHIHFRHFEFNDLKIITAVSGIGKVNGAICATLGYQVYGPDLIVNIGASGGIHGDIRIGDVVIASELKHHDVNATQFGYEHGQVPRMPTGYQANQALIECMMTTCAQLPFQLFSGLVCSGDSFISDAEVVVQLKNKFPEVLALDMESCGIAQACHQLGAEFFCIRGITDDASHSAHMDYKVALQLAMQNANGVLEKLLVAIKEN